MDLELTTFTKCAEELTTNDLFMYEGHMCKLDKAIDIYEHGYIVMDIIFYTNNILYTKSKIYLHMYRIMTCFKPITKVCYVVRFLHGKYQVVETELTEFSTETQTEICTDKRSSRLDAFLYKEDAVSFIENKRKEDMNYHMNSYNRIKNTEIEYITLD